MLKEIEAKHPFKIFQTKATKCSNISPNSFKAGAQANCNASNLHKPSQNGYLRPVTYSLV